MPEFRVTISSSKATPSVTHDGYFGKLVEFRIQRLSDRHAYVYEGHGGGKRFEMRCQILLDVGGVLVESSDPIIMPPDTAWKEKVVNSALEAVEKLQ